MKWACGRDGDNCYLDHRVVKFEAFNGCFPNPKMSFTDLDAICEIGGRFLVQEWKQNGHLPDGQRILLERLSRRSDFRAVVVDGDPMYMSVKSFAPVIDGEVCAVVRADLEDLRAYVKRWAHWAYGLKQEGR